jgi:hypothetical protein
LTATKARSRASAKRLAMDFVIRLQVSISIRTDQAGKAVRPRREKRPEPSPDPSGPSADPTLGRDRSVARSLTPNGVDAERGVRHRIVHG